MAAENTVMDAAGNLMDKKYFGIPFPLILVGVAGGAFLIRKLVKGQAAAKDVVSAPEGEGYATDVSGNKFASAYTGQAGGVPFGSGSLTSAGASGVSPTTPATEITNEGWLRRATEKLNLLGQWNVTDIQTALQTYISGGKLDQRQAAIVQQATMVEGIAPINVIPGGVAPDSQPNLYEQPQTYIRNAQTGLIAAYYSDGSITGIHNEQEWIELNGGWKPGGAPGEFNNPLPVIQVPGSDPVWQKAVPHNS